jgi:hypothetical protein
MGALGGGEDRAVISISTLDTWITTNIPVGYAYVTAFAVAYGEGGNEGVSSIGGTGGDGGNLAWRANQSVAGHTAIVSLVSVEGSYAVWDATQGLILVDTGTTYDRLSLGGRGGAGGTSLSPYFGGGGGGPGGLLSRGEVGPSGDSAILAGAAGDCSPIPELAALMGRGGGRGTGTSGIAWGGGGGGGRGLSPAGHGGPGAQGGVLLLFHRSLISTTSWTGGVEGG